MLRPQVSRALILALAALATAGCGPRSRAHTAAPEALGDTLVALNERLLSLVRAGQADSAAALYAADAVLFPPDGSVVRGRAAIARFWGAASTTIDSARTDVVDVRAAPGLGVLGGRYRLVLRGLDGTTSVARGTFLIVVQATDTGWRLAHDAWTSAPTPASDRP